MKAKTISIRIAEADLAILKKESEQLRISLSGLIRMRLLNIISLEDQAPK